MFVALKLILKRINGPYCKKVGHPCSMTSTANVKTLKVVKKHKRTATFGFSVDNKLSTNFNIRLLR